MPRPKVLVTSTPTMVRGAGDTASSPCGRFSAAHPVSARSVSRSTEERRIQPPRGFRQANGCGRGHRTVAEPRCAGKAEDYGGYQIPRLTVRSGAFLKCIDGPAIDPSACQTFAG